MINIKEKDLIDLEYISKGKFGKVYKKDDKVAYKIYHKRIDSDLTGIPYDNPALTLPQRHYNELIERSKKLKYTEGIYDKIYMDGKFAGVAIPFYDGKTLNDHLDDDYKTKVAISRQLIRNNKELANNCIYPNDYSLSNIMVTNNMAKIIDLDDIKTHVCLVKNPIFNATSISSLGITIQYYFNKQNHLYVGPKVFDYLKWDRFFNCYSYPKIEEYINEREKEYNYVFFDGDSDIEKLRELAQRKDTRLVLVTTEEEKNNGLLKKVQLLHSLGIPMYDVVLADKIEDYHKLENIKEGFTLSKESKTLKKVYKK